MMVLPKIPPNIVKNVDNTIREFLWNGRKSKIAYKVLQNPKEHGGVQLVDLAKKDIALKTTWPQILEKEQQYASMVYRICRWNNLNENIWRCST